MGFEALVRGAAMGDKQAWRRLTACLTPRLRGFFASRCRALDYKDLVQDTLLVIWTKLPNFEMRSEAAFVSWVRKIAQFVALAALRQMVRDEKLMRALGDVERPPSTRVTSRLDRAKLVASVLREVDNLPESYRRAAENMLEGGDARDLAERAGIKWVSARVLENRTRVLLRRRLAPSTPAP
jgi:DNA-directed RNA polymerase specialized sigma24 family protein